MTAEQIEAANAVAKFARARHLSRQPARRRRSGRYTELSLALEKAVNDARRTPPAELEKLFEPADRSSPS